MNDYCKDCYFHATHATTYQCALQQLVGRGLIRVIVHPTVIETRFYERTSYDLNDHYLMRSMAPLLPAASTTYLEHFVVTDLPMESAFLEALPIRYDPQQPTHCPLVIHAHAYHNQE